MWCVLVVWYYHRDIFKMFILLFYLLSDIYFSNKFQHSFFVFFSGVFQITYYANNSKWLSVLFIRFSIIYLMLKHQFGKNHFPSLFLLWNFTQVLPTLLYKYKSIYTYICNRMLYYRLRYCFALWCSEIFLLPLLISNSNKISQKIKMILYYISQ